MSDTFNHELDAWESQNWDQNPCNSNFKSSRFNYRFDKTPPDPNFYHSKVKYESLTEYSEKMLQIKIDGLTFEIPKSICNDDGCDIGTRLLNVHTKIFNEFHNKAKAAAKHVIT